MKKILIVVLLNMIALSLFAADIQNADDDQLPDSALSLIRSNAVIQPRHDEPAETFEDQEPLDDEDDEIIPGTYRLPVEVHPRRPNNFFDDPNTVAPAA